MSKIENVTHSKMYSIDISSSVSFCWG